jgi:hypothetical protein
MKSVKTALGRTLDMSALAAKNEKVRAISNVPVNARGDIIDNRGNVKVPREEISKQYYKNNVPGSDSTSVSINQEPSSTANKKADAANIEVSRVTRTRADGTQYDEVEYSDGSMTEEDHLDSGNQL